MQGKDLDPVPSQAPKTAWLFVLSLMSVSVLALLRAPRAQHIEPLFQSKTDNFVPVCVDVWRWGILGIKAQASLEQGRCSGAELAPQPTSISVRTRSDIWESASVSLCGSSSSLQDCLPVLWFLLICPPSCLPSSIINLASIFLQMVAQGTAWINFYRQQHGKRAPFRKSPRIVIRQIKIPHPSRTYESERLN